MPRILDFLGGLLVGLALVIYDELLTFAMYVGKCCYPIPLIGAYDVYTASFLPFSLIIAGTLLLVIPPKLLNTQ